MGNVIEFKVPMFRDEPHYEIDGEIISYTDLMQQEKDTFIGMLCRLNSTKVLDFLVEQGVLFKKELETEIVYSNAPINSKYKGSVTVLSRPPTEVEL